MNIANIVVNQTTGICTMRKRIPAGAVGLTVTVHFADPLWDRLEKTVVFRGGGLEKICDRFDGTTAVIPAEVIAEPDTVLYFGIWGHDPEGILQLPLIEVRLGTTERATQPGSDPEADPDLPIWAKLQDDIDDLWELVESGTGTGGGGLKVTVVQTLPTENISTGTIYMVPNDQAQENVYTEYLYVNGSWEIVGSQQLDLTGYVKSINGVKPDPETGDIKISIPDSGGDVDYVVQDTAPEDTSVLWVDPTDNSDDGFQEAVNAALKQAKESGEFNGKDGNDYILTDPDRNVIAASVKASLNTESWTFTLEDGSTVTKEVYVG